MPEGDLYTMLEAARWAPSAYNIQPWRFIYALRNDAHWEDFLSLLDPFNAGWAKNASALLFLVSNTLMPAQGSRPAKPSGTHRFDAGAAWAQLALQATALGYQAHAMAGIHFDQVKLRLSVPEHYHVEIAVAIGRQTDSRDLPRALQAREKPSLRRPLAQLAFRARFDPNPIDAVSVSQAAGAAQR
jgi:nitroreductase